MCRNRAEGMARGKRFSHAGKFWKIDDVEVLPQPAQRPQPLPVWTVAFAGSV
jgi:alkanesulfonate monooxygenase SsuD/methylene tetrahydromethanopterin reductase-like flavin-dependent oxidoreductase (luciferase family)